MIKTYYLLAIQKVLGLHLNKYYLPLLAAFGSWEEVWRAKKIPEQVELPDYLWDKLRLEKQLINPELIAKELRQKGIGVITRENAQYPDLLRHIANAPCILYYCGRLSLLNKTSLAVVGSRRATAYGLSQARHLSAELAKHGLVITSGMARGIDTAAHQGALEGGGDTIAVLGCGLDVPYPRENSGLLQRIKEKGLVISEYPPGTAPLNYNFPIRNRIISGISQAVFVVEAQARSGTLITCDFALEQGKDIFALPGPVTNPNSIGTLRLIQNGAKLVIHSGDILEEMGYGIIESLFSRKDEITRSISSKEKAVLDKIGWEPVHIDSLLSDAASAAQIYQDLLVLEIKGLVKQLPGKYYTKI